MEKNSESGSERGGEREREREGVREEDSITRWNRLWCEAVGV
jgi:hypothetical protein